MAALVAATVNGSNNGGAGGGDSGCVAVMTTAAAVAASDADSNDANGVSANGREARNLAEKQRRDKLNASIQELATMVPHAAESTRRLDKTAVLRFATHGLRLQYVFGKSAIRRRRKLNLKVPNRSSNGNASNHGVGEGGGAAEHTGNSLINGDTPQLTDKLMQLLDSFFLTLTCNGQIVLVSGSVEQLLGHCQSDLYGQNLLQITHPDDQALLRQQLIPRDIETLFYQQQQQQQQHHQQHGRQQQQRRRKQSHSQSHSTSASDDEEEMEQLEDQEREQHDQLQLRDEEHDEDDDEETHRTRTPSPETIAHLAAIDERLRADRRCFTVRLARASTRAEATRHYEVVKIDGCFRRSDSSVTGGAAANYPIVSQLIRRSRNNNMLAAAAAAASAAASSSSSASTLPPPCLPQHDAIAQAALHGISGNDIVLVAMARVMRESSSTPNLSLLCRQPEPYQLEYRTRHLIDGSIIDCDQRIGIVAGYMKDEVRNLSPFSFMHLDDVRWVIVALRQMYDCNNDYGESCYRLLSRNGHFIYLQSKGFLEIDKSSNKVHSFLCVNTLLDEQSGKRKVQEMKNKFSTIIKADIPTDTSPDLPASRAPQQLERIVLYLIENLQKSADGTATKEHGGHEATATHNGGDVTMMDAIDDAGCCSSPGSSNATLTLEEQAPSPSMAQPQVLALVPPAPGHVKHSISKSVDVVNVTSARNLQYQQQKQQQKQLQQQLLQQQQYSPASGVIRQLSCCLSESSTLSPGSASSLELPDEANNSDGSTPPPAPLSISAAAPRVSVLQRVMTTPTKPTATAVAATPATPSPTQLQTALSNTLRSLDTQLVTIAEEAQTLYQQQQKQRKALLPKFERQMDAIMLEHQMQKQLLVNITSEYNATTATAAPVSVITKQTTTSSESGNSI